MSNSYDHDPHYSHSGSGHSADKRFSNSHDPRSSSQSVNHRGGNGGGGGGDYRHSEGDLHGRDHAARHTGLSAHDLSYSESPTTNLPEDNTRDYHGGRGSTEDYYRGSGQAGGSGSWYYDKYYR